MRRQKPETTLEKFTNNYANEGTQVCGKAMQATHFSGQGWASAVEGDHIIEFTNYQVDQEPDPPYHALENFSLLLGQQSNSRVSRTSFLNARQQLFKSRHDMLKSKFKEEK